MHDIPGLAEEPYSVPKDMLRSRVEFYYTQQSKESTDQFWKRTGKDWGKKLDSFANKKGALENDLAATIHPSDSPETKLREIYLRVQKIRNLSFETAKTAEETKREKIVSNANVEDVLKHGYGTWQDINALFVGLARAAGFDATLVYIAPRDRTLFLPNYQDTAELQADLVDVKLGSQDIYLDPASPQYPYGLIPWYENGVKGVRADKDGGEFITVPPDDDSRAQILRHTSFRLNPAGSLAGNLTVDFVGQEGAVWRSEDRNDDDTGRRKDLHDEIKGWLPSNATFTITKFSDWDDNSKPIHVEGTVTIPSDNNRALGRIILPLSLIQSQVARSFTSAQRVNDVYFHYPYQEEDDTVIELP
ncbi:MAG: transglutaminase domain-containing protein, partial [Candidatus Acidiferrales bacterium]